MPTNDSPIGQPAPCSLSVEGNGHVIIFQVGNGNQYTARNPDPEKYKEIILAMKKEIESLRGLVEVWKEIALNR